MRHTHKYIDTRRDTPLPTNKGQTYIQNVYKCGHTHIPMDTNKCGDYVRICMVCVRVCHFMRGVGLNRKGSASELSKLGLLSLCQCDAAVHRTLGILFKVARVGGIAGFHRDR